MLDQFSTNLPTLLNGFLLTPGDLDSLALLDIITRLHWDFRAMRHLLLVAIVLGGEELLVQRSDSRWLPPVMEVDQTGGTLVARFLLQVRVRW